MIIDYLKVFPHYLFPKKALSALAGVFANSQNKYVKNFLINNLIKKYNVNMSEALLEKPEQYLTFNDFFIRHLKPTVRPQALTNIISPVDGCISEIGDISDGLLLQAKGRYYSTHELLASTNDVAAQFKNGKFVTIYLSPKDYHRVHMPIEGTLKQMIYVPGKLFSVQPLTTAVIPNLFARNERVVTFFDTPLGLMAMVMVGATIVGTIGTSWHGDLVRSRNILNIDYTKHPYTSVLLPKGAEMGYFKLGSTVILLFAEGHKFKWDDNVVKNSTIKLFSGLG